MRSPTIGCAHDGLCGLKLRGVVKEEDNKGRNVQADRSNKNAGPFQGPALFHLTTTATPPP